MYLLKNIFVRVAHITADIYFVYQLPISEASNLRSHK